MLFYAIDCVQGFGAGWKFGSIRFFGFWGTLHQCGIPQLSVGLGGYSYSGCTLNQWFSNCVPWFTTVLYIYPRNTQIMSINLITPTSIKLNPKSLRSELLKHKE